MEQSTDTFLWSGRLDSERLRARFRATCSCSEYKAIMGNHQPCQFGSSCYDGYGYEGCCLPVRLQTQDDSVLRPSWPPLKTGQRPITSDDDSYTENYRFHIKDDDRELCLLSQKRATAAVETCRRPLRAMEMSSISRSSSQRSDTEGAFSYRGGFECRSDPSMIRRTTTSQCERDDIDDDVARSRDAESVSSEPEGGILT